MPRAIGFLVYPGFQLLDATGPIAAFEIAGRLSPGAYSLHFLSLRGGLVPSTSGMVVQTKALAEAPPLDTLLIAGGDAVKAPASCPETLAFVRGAGRHALPSRGTPAVFCVRACGHTLCSSQNR